MMDKAIKHGLILAAFFWCASALAQTSINVNCATQDLHAALATANANSTAANLYTLNISGTCFANAGTTPGTFTITAPMTLQQDPTATTPAVLDGSALNSLSATTVLVNNATGVRLIGLVVQKGVGPDRLSNGGQIQGGGIFNNGDLQIIKSTIQNNNGGLSGSAGGIENKGNIAIRQSLIANNTASGYGGGLDNSSPLGSNVSISQSTFYQNSAGGGNAIAENSRANTVILTSTFYKNSGDLGAIYSSNDWGTLTISQTTITGNDGRYGGIYIKNGGAYNVTISQSIVANNKGTINATSPNIYSYDGAPINIDDASMLVTDADAAANLGIPIVNGVPTLADNGGPTPTLKLGSGSLGVNAIAVVNGACSPPTNSTSNPATDQRGAPRPGVGKTGCDVGAYETGDARLIATPNPVDFVSTKVGSTSTLGVHISNTGNSVAIITSSVTPATTFAIASALGTSSLNLLSNSDMQLSFTPGTPGSKLGSLTLTYPGISAPTLTLSVPLMGTGEALSPSQLMQDILSYFNQSVRNSTIVGIGKNASIAKRRLDMFSDLLENADKAIVKNKFDRACGSLKTAAKRSDGQSKPPDYITGTDLSTINLWIGNLMMTLNCPAIKHEDCDDDRDDDAGNVKDH